MQTSDHFFISYKNQQVRVSTVLIDAKIFFSVHLPVPVTIAEGLVGNELSWYDLNDGETPLALELGELIEATGV
jgi:hypothetical protein